MVHAVLFVSMPRGPHDQITKDAAKQAGWPRRAMRPLLAAVRRPDLRDFGWRPRWRRWLRIDATNTYRARHHADRVPPVPHEEAWLAVAHYIQDQRRQAAAGTGKEAVAALGNALHAAQDIFSHSNFVELDADTRSQVVEALWCCRPAPAALRLTAFSPGAARPGEPHDPYPHAHYAKDAPGHNAVALRRRGGKSAYRAAQDAATAFSVRIIRSFLDEWTGSRRSLSSGRRLWLPWRAQR